MRPLIDIHTHYFTARYWPLRGILRANYDWIPDRIAEAFIRSVIWATEEHPELNEEPTELGAPLRAMAGAMGREPTGHENPAAHELRQRLVGDSDEEIIRALVELLPEDVVLADDPDVDACIRREADPALVEPAMAVHELQFETGPGALPLIEAMLVTRRLAIESALTRSVRAGRGNRGGRGRRRKRHALPILKFIAEATSCEYERVENYQKLVPGQLLTVHHMMDLDRPYFNDDSTIPYPRQITRLRKLASLYPGKILGFVAFDPYRGETKIIKDALERGFAGVKIYPPTGYRPIGNDDPAISKITHAIGGVSGNDIDGRLLEVYDLCLGLNAPLMFHCTESGFERDEEMHVPVYGSKDKTAEGTGNLSDPRAYVDLLDRGGNYAQLRLCIGHAGGHDWIKEKLYCHPEHADIRTAHSFCHAAYLLCRRYKNVFCDFGHLTEIIDPEHRKRFVENLIELLKQDEPSDLNPCRFFDKIMFGSDYYMPNEYGNYREFAEAMIDAFSEKPLKGQADKFFIDNAKRFLNLRSFLDRKPKLINSERNALLKLIDET